MASDLICIFELLLYIVVNKDNLNKARTGSLELDEKVNEISPFHSVVQLIRASQ